MLDSSLPLQVNLLLKLAKEKVSLAKALIRASEKAKNPGKGKKKATDDEQGSNAGS